MNDNVQKKKAIDTILAKYNAKLAVLVEKRDKVISEFFEVLKKKKIKELRDSFESL